jgi:hypothetical protein
VREAESGRGIARACQDACKMWNVENAYPVMGYLLVHWDVERAD